MRLAAELSVRLEAAELLMRRLESAELLLRVVPVNVLVLTESDSVYIAIISGVRHGFVRSVG